MSGIDAIAAERRRQIEVKGWTSNHDDQHGPGALAGSASAYAMSAASSLMCGSETPVVLDPPPFFGFDASDWNPETPREDLVRAGALIAAAIDQLERLRDQLAN
ncbi:hypothetical protein [Tateyamaria sp. syn59]|uniref:hypothetical protein n=1 Tax=Tateyamaria sp. syn59 TaxID=2576942 RepID=UPI0011BF4F37|nr:hypothetical protein [Tateyamaria sp. syn59]